MDTKGAALRKHVPEDGGFYARGSTDMVALIGVATEFGDRLTRLLDSVNLRVRRFIALTEAQRAGVLGDYDLVLIEGLPGGHTDFTACYQAATASDAAIMALADRPEDSNRILALELGADDWVCSSASDREVLAKIRALSRRRERLLRSARKSSVHRFAGWTVHRERREITHIDGRTEHLTASECDLLLFFMENIGRPLSCDELAAASGGRGVARSVSVTVSRLRRKLGPDCAGVPVIRNVWGVGYLMDSRETVSLT